MVRRIGLCLGFILAVLTLVNAVTLVSYAEVRINQKDQGSEKQTTTEIEICGMKEKDGVSVRVDVEGFYKFDLKIRPECKADGNKSGNGAVKKEKRE
jgi:hypothetical protein